MDIVERLLKPINEKEDYFYFISQWPNEEPNVHDALRFNAAKEIEKLREALKLERQLRDDALRAFNEARAALKEDE